MVKKTIKNPVPFPDGVNLNGKVLLNCFFPKMIRMKIKHKILEELYQVQLVNKKDNVTMIDVSLNLDTLRKRIKTNDKDFHSSLEVLNANKEIVVSWEEEMAYITRDGIISLSNKKYHNEYIRLLREKIYFWLKIIGAIAVIITTIWGIVQIVDYFTPQP